jgi:hypothetical protein
MEAITGDSLLYLDILNHMLVEAVRMTVDLATALIALLRVDVNEFRYLFRPPATIATMATRGTAFRAVSVMIWLYLRLENLTHHSLQVMTQCLPFLLKLCVFLPQLFDFCLRHPHQLLHFIKPLA